MIPINSKFLTIRFVPQIVVESVQHLPKKKKNLHRVNVPSDRSSRHA